MTRYRPTIQEWHSLLPDECSCQPAWKERNMVDDQCEWHRLIDAVEWLLESGWTVKPPTTKEEQWKSSQPKPASPPTK